MQPPDSFVFFLGGHDLEMLTIRELLLEAAPDRLYDKGLAWGAKASAYRQEIAKSLEQGLTPVLVELVNDLGLQPTQFVKIDHHGKHAGANQPTSLHQVFNFLGMPSERWTRWLELVATNDSGYIPALVEMGATLEEIVQIRASDRAAQGITPAEEAAGERAVANAKSVADGMITLVPLPHSRTATVTDRLEAALGGPGYRNLVVYCPDQVNFFGSGTLVRALHQHFPRGWYGGALPERGFWGHDAPVPDILTVLFACLEGTG